MQEKGQKVGNENEVDLGVFFNQLGIILQKLGLAIKALLAALFGIIITLIIFIKRKIIFLLIGALLGLGLALFVYLSKGPSYTSELVVKANFESSRLLHSKADYFNALIKQNRFAELASILKISEQEAGRLMSFSVKPVKNELEAAKLYKQNFLLNNRNRIYGYDTTLPKVIEYENFQDKLTVYDYPLQQVKVYSSQANIYNRLEKGFLEAITNERLLQLRDSTRAFRQQEEEILRRSINGIDSLRLAYFSLLKNSKGVRESSTNVFITGKENRNPELDLFDKELLLRDELYYAKQTAIDENEILQVYSNFNPSGTKLSGYEEEVAMYPLIGFLLAFILLLVLELFKSIDAIEKTRTINRVNK